MARRHVFSLSLLVAILLGACNFPVAPSGDSYPPEGTLAQASQSTRLADMVSASRTAQRASPSPETPSPSITPVIEPSSSTPTDSGSPAFNPTPAAPPTPICDRAAPGNPIDITIPDDSLLEPGQSFSKTWRLVNVGTCTWNQGYAAVFFSGDLLGAGRTDYFSDKVAPNQPVDITVDMIAPLEAGSYQGNWKLSNPKGELFGIGPSGNAPFWVRIIVAQIDTPTPQPTATLTPTAVIYISGLANLIANEGLDLDTKQVAVDGTTDLLFSIADDKSSNLTPVNGARVGLFGAQKPGYPDCQTAALAAIPLLLNVTSQGAYFCYRTNLGLPGWAHLMAVNEEERTISLEILTWSIP